MGHGVMGLQKSGDGSQGVSVVREPGGYVTEPPLHGLFLRAENLATVVDSPCLSTGVIAMECGEQRTIKNIIEGPMIAPLGHILPSR